MSLTDSGHTLTRVLTTQTTPLLIKLNKSYMCKELPHFLITIVYEKIELLQTLQPNEVEFFHRCPLP